MMLRLRVKSGLPQASEHHSLRPNYFNRGLATVTRMRALKTSIGSRTQGTTQIAFFRNITTLIHVTWS